jgi:hypothetical protein
MEGAVQIKESARAGRSYPRRGLVAAGLAALVLTVPPLSGCAVVGRLFTAAEVLSAAGDVLDAVAQPAAHRSAEVRGVVNGTHGAGLRLRASPGAGQVAVLPDGTAVAVLCLVSGPHVRGPRGATSDWSYVRTAEGGNGYLSNAYLELDTDPEIVHLCRGEQ